MNQDAVDEIADLFWEQHASRFEGMTDRWEAMGKAEDMAFQFLRLNPWLWTDQGIAPLELAEEMSERMP